MPLPENEFVHIVAGILADKGVCHNFEDRRRCSRFLLWSESIGEWEEYICGIANDQPFTWQRPCGDCSEFEPDPREEYSSATISGRLLHVR